MFKIVALFSLVYGYAQADLSGSVSCRAIGSTWDSMRDCLKLFEEKKEDPAKHKSFIRKLELNYIKNFKKYEDDCYKNYKLLEDDIKRAKNSSEKEGLKKRQDYFSKDTLRDLYKLMKKYTNFQDSNDREVKRRMEKREREDQEDLEAQKKEKRRREEKRLADQAYEEYSPIGE